MKAIQKKFCCSSLQASLLSCIITCSFSGCGAKQNAFNNIDSKIVDSLIEVRRINNRTLLVNFGHDAVTAIDTDQGIVIVDAGISTGLTAKYRKLIVNEFHKEDFIYVINTHGHHDHTGGNSVFPQARVVGHENWSSDASERWINHSKAMTSCGKTIQDYEQMLQQSVPNSAEWYDNYTQKIRYMCAYSDIVNQIPAGEPDITFQDSLTLDPGGTIFEIIHFGKSHSNSDIVICVPELKLIFTGDLFSKYGRPGINLSAAEEIKWNQAIAWIQKRIDGIEKVIEGHGLVLSTDDLKQFNNYILSRSLAQ